MKTKSIRRVLLAGALSMPVLGGALAFSASNTVPASKAGDGTGAITGYVLSSIRYGLNTADPGKLDSVSFSLDSTPAAGSTINMQLTSGGSWYTCSNTDTAVTCATTSPQATVRPADNLRVVVAY